MVVRRTLVVPLASPSGEVWHEIRRPVGLDVENEPRVGVVDLTLSLSPEETLALRIPVAFAAPLAGTEARVPPVTFWPQGATGIDADGRLDGRPVTEAELAEVV